VCVLLFFLSFTIAFFPISLSSSSSCCCILNKIDVWLLIIPTTTIATTMGTTNPNSTHCVARGGGCGSSNNNNNINNNVRRLVVIVVCLAFCQAVVLVESTKVGRGIDKTSASSRTTTATTTFRTRQHEKVAAAVAEEEEAIPSSSQHSPQLRSSSSSSRMLGLFTRTGREAPEFTDHESGIIVEEETIDTIDTTNTTTPSMEGFPSAVVGRWSSGDPSTSATDTGSGYNDWVLREGRDSNEDCIETEEEASFSNDYEYEDDGDSMYSKSGKAGKSQDNYRVPTTTTATTTTTNSALPAPLMTPTAPPSTLPPLFAGRRNGGRVKGTKSSKMSKCEGDGGAIVGPPIVCRGARCDNIDGGDSGYPPGTDGGDADGDGYPDTESGTDADGDGYPDTDGDSPPIVDDGSNNNNSTDVPDSAPPITDGGNSTDNGNSTAPGDGNDGDSSLKDTAGCPADVFESTYADDPPPTRLIQADGTPAGLAALFKYPEGEFTPPAYISDASEFAVSVGLVVNLQNINAGGSTSDITNDGFFNGDDVGAEINKLHEPIILYTGGCGLQAEEAGKAYIESNTRRKLQKGDESAYVVAGQNWLCRKCLSFIALLLFCSNCVLYCADCDTPTFVTVMCLVFFGDLTR
jgi:putative hemolysin